MTKRLLAMMVVLVLALSACGSESDSTDDTTATGSTETTGATETTETTESTDTTEPEEMALSGEITVLTNRTDIVDTRFVDYVAAFNETHPDVKVSFEALTDYEGETRIRMNTEDYGDVLLIPAAITPDQLPDFFEPLGTVDELGDTYRYIDEASFDGTVYGLATFGTATGIVYNKAVFEEAGVTEVPNTPDEFLAALEAIQENTDAIPYYTNYAAGWPMSQWESHRGSISGDPDYVNDLIDVDAPWTEGNDHYVIDSLLADIVSGGFSEEDPTTTDWETSKVLLGNGEIASMVLGSWSITQMQGAADDPSVIGYMPFPSNVDGTTYSVSNGDFKMAINKHSDNKEAARAFLDFFINESGFADDEGAIPPRLDADFPDTLSAFSDLGVEYITINPAPEGEEGVVDNIANEAEIDLWGNIYRQRIIDAARGASGESVDDVFADLNSRWAEARAAVLEG